MVDALSSNLERVTRHLDTATFDLDHGCPQEAHFELSKARDLIARLVDILQKED